MKITSKSWSKPATQALQVAVLALIAPLASAQQDTAKLFNAFDVAQAQAMEKLVEINENPATQAARDELEKQIVMVSNMTMSEMMAAGGGHSGMNMNMGMNGPYGEEEVEARVELMETVRGDFSVREAATAFDDSAPLNEHTAMVIKHGRIFENRLFAIYADDMVGNKQAAVAQAIEDYLSDDRHSVPTEPKDSGYLLSHPYATAFSVGFPRLSDLLWSNQWMQLAALEAVIQAYLDDEYADSIDIATERYWNKVGSAGGMTMFPAPSELPMAPAITPNLYSQSPEAAIILDNLNTLEAVIADILAYPNLEDRDAIIDGVIASFTNKEQDLSDPMNYLLFALRGGIYNQGGPAVGELMQSERNRSRSAMNMQHSMIMQVQ